MIVINVPWVFAIVLFSALVVNLFIPIFQSRDHITGCVVLMVLSAISGGFMELYFEEMGWRKKGEDDD